MRDEDTREHRLTVYADTNAQFPYYLSDLLWFLADSAVIRVLWTHYLADETITVVARQYDRHGEGRTRQQVTTQWDAIRERFKKDEVSEQEWNPRATTLIGPDPDDIPHMAAAIAGHANVLVTSDRTGFPPDQLEPAGVVVMRPDVFLVALLDAYPADVMDVVIRRARSLAHPPMTVIEYLDALGRSVPKFATAALARNGLPVPLHVRLRLGWRRLRPRWSTG